MTKREICDEHRTADKRNAHICSQYNAQRKPLGEDQPRNADNGYLIYFSTLPLSLYPVCKYKTNPDPNLRVFPLLRK